MAALSTVIHARQPPIGRPRHNSHISKSLPATGRTQRSRLHADKARATGVQLWHASMASPAPEQLPVDWRTPPVHPASLQNHVISSQGGRGGI